MVRQLTPVMKFARKHYFFSLIFLCVLFVVVFAGYKLLFSRPTYVYAKVKVSQGYWWAATQKPSVWFIDALKTADEEKGLRGEPVAKLLSMTYYPWYDTPGQYDVYLFVRLSVSKLGGAGKYSFKRSPLGVGAPIDFEFPLVQVTGTVTALSNKPITDRYVEKTVMLTKKDAYTKDYPFTYDNIKIGDSYFNGSDTIFRILDKRLEPQIWSVANSLTGTILEQKIETNQNIVVKAMIKGVMHGDKLIFSEDQVISEGKDINASTANYTFKNFTVAKIE